MMDLSIRGLKLTDWLEAVIGNDFWTRLDELVADLEEYGYTVYAANDEYITIDTDTTEEDGTQILLYLGHANKTIWIDKVRIM